MRVLIIGNSVALRVRPTIDRPNNLTYTHHLYNYLNQSEHIKNAKVINLATGGDTINDIYEKFDHYIRSYPDIIIINLGVVDASTREIPRWFFNIINNKRDSLFRRMLKDFYNGLIKKIRRPLVFLRLKKTWICKKRFKRLFRKLILDLKKETNADVIVLPINPGNFRIERQIPGSLKNYIEYSRIMQDISEENNAHFLIPQGLEGKTDFPDGIHFSSTGHKKIANQLFNKIKEIAY